MAKLTHIDRHVAARVQGKRLDKGRTQGELARAIGVSYQQYQKYEKGETRISAGGLYWIGRTLGEHPGVFYDGLYGTGNTPLPLALDPQALRLAEIIQRLPDKEVADALHRLPGDKVLRTLRLLLNLTS